MQMTNTQLAISVALLVLGTALTRFLPFWCIPRTKPVPQVLSYLGTVLPCAVMGLLVVYCLKDVSFAAAPHGIPEVIAVAVTAGLHVWKKNTLLSIAGGTLLYMLLVQAVF